MLFRPYFASRRLTRTYRAALGTPKIIYALTPPARLRNVGDHAQVVAIYRWLKKHFPERPILEADKGECVDAIDGLKKLVEPGDWIVLHSGGNLGDRGMWSETARRTIISSFVDNPIVSLPQTIFFSDTESGRREREVSRQIYGQHPDLTVIGRDPRSGELAKELFPRALSFCVPDFVLSLPARPGKTVDKDKPRVLSCLRRDRESVFDAAQRDSLVASIPYDGQVFDTTIEEPIARDDRERVLDETLALFARHDLVVTDRFHGLIFALLTRRPTVVLPTVDHKLTSAFHWFEGVSFIRLARDVDQVPALLEEVKQCDDFSTPDFNALYFDRIWEKIEERKAR